MHATAPAFHGFRGVLCRHCGKPVRLPASIVARENILKQREPILRENWASRIFPVRCRACWVESIYAMDQIASFPESHDVSL
jgi:hypothetical protein